MACLTNTKKKGRWCIDFYDQNGKRRLKVLPQGATKTEAKKWLREIEEQIEKRIYIPSKDAPSFKKVAGDWLEQKRHNVRASTCEGYEGHLRNHFFDIDPIKINHITTQTVEKFITEKLSVGTKRATLRKILITFNQVMNYSVRHRLIDYNPVREAERPKARNIEKPESDKIRVLSPIQINSLLSIVSDRKYFILFKLAVFTGAREGELLGLKWTDVLWATNQLYIKRTFNKGAWYDPKTKTSRRKIDLGPSVVSDLKKWRLECPPSELDLIFPNEAGKPMCQANMMHRHFQPALKAAGIPKLRFHDLRHTYASLLIEQGENLKYIQTQLGHSNPSVTLNTYAHLLKPINQEAACRLEKMVLDCNGDQMETKSKKGFTALNVNP